MTAIADSLATAPARRAAAAKVRAIPVVLEAVPTTAWDEIAAKFDGLCQEQLMAFAAVRWPGTTLEPMVFRLNGEVVGGALVIVQRLPLGIGAIAVCKWGPMLADTGRPDALAIYAGMVEAMIAEFSRKRGLMLSIVPKAAASTVNEEYEHLVARGFRPGALLNYPLRYIVRIGLADDEQRKSLEQKWRYQLGKAERHGMSFEHGTPDRLAEFTALYERMLVRKRFTDYSAYDTIPAMMALPEGPARPELFFVREGGEVIAGAIIFKGGERAVYLYGATLDRALPLRAGYFLHWNIVRWLRDHTKAGWYDLGGSDGFAGLHQFKKGLVGSAGFITPVPRIANYADSRFVLMLGSSALWAREGYHEVKRRLALLQKGVAQPTLPRHVEQPSDVRL